MPSTTETCVCTPKKCKSTRSNTYPFLSGILIALLPKCPWCILAYSSAITMCSGSKLYTPTESWTTYLPILFSFITLGLILYKYKGKKTIVAALLVLFGSGLILNATFYYGNASEYLIGTCILLFGVWVNGSFLYFFNKCKSTFYSIFVGQA